MPSDSNTSRGPLSRGGVGGSGDSWQNGRSLLQQEWSQELHNDYQPPLQPAEPRYRPPHHHDQNYNNHHASVPRPWVGRRDWGSFGNMQKQKQKQQKQKQQQQRPHPHQRSNDAAHLTVPRDDDHGHDGDDDFKHGSALAARIHFPNSSPLPNNPKLPNESGKTQQPQPLDPTPAGPKVGNVYHHPRNLKPRLPADFPLLGTPKKNIIDDTEGFVEKYRHGTEHSERANRYLTKNGPMYHLQDVFMWWWSRILDRLQRKQETDIVLDPHERILHKIEQAVLKEEGDWTGDPDEYSTGLIPMVNYYADHIIPENGFTVNQVEEARRDPNRWARRNKMENQLQEKDPTGELLLRWRAEKRQVARERYEAREREQELEKRRVYDSRDKYKRRPHPGKPNSRHPREPKVTSIIGARFDAKNRIGKGCGSPAWKGGGGRNGGRGGKRSGHGRQPSASP